MKMTITDILALHKRTKAAVMQDQRATYEAAYPLTLEYLLAAHGFDRFELRYQQYLPESMLALPRRFPGPEAPALEHDFAEAMQKLQVVLDVAFRNFIYALVARR